MLVLIAICLLLYIQTSNIFHKIIISNRIYRIFSIFIVAIIDYRHVLFITFLFLQNYFFYLAFYFYFITTYFLIYSISTNLKYRIKYRFSLNIYLYTLPTLFSIHSLLYLVEINLCAHLFIIFHFTYFLISPLILLTFLFNLLAFSLRLSLFISPSLS